MWLHLLQQFVHFVQWKNHIFGNAFYPNPSWPWTWPSLRPSCRPRTAAPARLPGEKFGSEKLFLVATKRRREAIKRNFSQPASLTSYSGENFGAEILLTAAGQNWAKWQSKGLVLIDKKWKRCDTNGPNLERYLEHEVWIEVQKLLFQGLPTSYFSTVKGTDQWPRNIRHGIWNILWKTQPYNFYKLGQNAVIIHIHWILFNARRSFQRILTIPR